jgi:polygalacturonase
LLAGFAAGAAMARRSRALGAPIPERPGAPPAGRPESGQIFDITRFGAVNDGKTLSTEAIQRAIRACVHAGGGRVLVPPGQYLSGGLFLGDNVELHLVAGARLRASPRFEDFPPLMGRSEGIERLCHSSLLNGSELENVAITGQGTLDGNGEAWWDAHRVTHDMRLARHLTREADSPPGAPLRWPRPRVVNLMRCQGVVVRDVTIENSPSWSLHLVYCDGAVVDGVITTGLQAPNIDGIVVDSCSNVRLANCLLAQGGEAIALKSGYNEDGRRVNIPCENVIITNCHATYSVGAAIAIGSETAGWIRNVAINNCTVSRSKYGIHIKAPRGRGGGVENVRISNILLNTIDNTGLIISNYWNSVIWRVLFEEKKPSGDPETDRTMVVPAGEGTPTFRNISISGVTMGAVSRIAVVEGLPERPIDGVHLRDLFATASKEGIIASRVHGLTIDGLTVNVLESPMVCASHVRRLTLRALAGTRPRGSQPVVQLEDTADAFIQGCNVPTPPADFVRLVGHSNSGISLIANNLLPR